MTNTNGKLATYELATHDVDLGLQVVELSGALDMSGLKAVRNGIEDFVSNFEGRFLLFDLTDLKFLNSNAVAFLLMLQQSLAEKNAEMFVANASEYVEDVLTVIGFKDAVKCFDSIEECINSISQ